MALAGRLTSADGVPVSGATIDIRSANGGEGSATTDAEGRFTFTAPPGPTRELTARYTAFSNFTEPTVTAAARLLVSGAVRVGTPAKRVRRGGRVVLNGRLTPGVGGFPARPIVVLQGRRPGKRQKWRTFRTVRALADGFFSGAYRFDRNVRGRFGLRARVATQPAFPWLADASKPVNVRVR